MLRPVTVTAPKAVGPPRKRTLPPCSSYKQAFEAMKIRRSGCYSLIALFVFASFFTIVFQARLAFPTSFLSRQTITFAIAVTIISFILLLAHLQRYQLWRPIQTSKAADIMSKVRSTDNWIMVTLYAFSGFFLVRLYFGHLIADTYTENLFVYPQGLHIHRANVRQLNEDNLFVSFYGILLGLCFAVRHIWKGEWEVQMSTLQLPKYLVLKWSLATILYRGGIWSLQVFGCAYVSFLLFDGSLYRLAASFFGFYTSVLDAPIVGFGWLDLYLVARTILAGCLTVCIWETVDRVFDVFYGTIELISDQYENANALLISGLQAKDDSVIQATAFAELAHISKQMPKRRATIFLDASKNMNNTTWSQISTECLKIIETLRNNIEIEYTGIKLAAAPVPAAKMQEPQNVNRIQLQDANVFLAPRVDTALLDDRTATLFSHVWTPTASVLKEALPANAIAAPQQAPKDLVFKLLQALETKAQRWNWFQKFRAVTAERKTRSIFSNYFVVVSAVQALGNLVSSSFKEDEYGLVQRDVRKILNSLQATLDAVEKIVRNPPPGYKQLIREHSSPVLLLEPEAVLLALRDSINNIKITFHESLSDI